MFVKREREGERREWRRHAEGEGREREKKAGEEKPRLRTFWREWGKKGGMSNSFD